uniref:Uncharacterized protein n=1 Tax=Cucumis melo TaxID=3656 RepID=A0A9I9CSN7_CUCME
MATPFQTKTPRVFCIATADTKLDELRFISDSVRCNLNSFSTASSFKVEVTIVDVSTSHQIGIDSLDDFFFVSREEVLSCYNLTGNDLPDDRGKAISIMSKALESYLSKAKEDGIIAGVIGLGGSGGTSLISSALKSLQIGIPKLIVSTVASGQTESYIGTSDVILFPSIVDVCGINSVSRVILSNAGSAFAGMVVGRLETLKDSCDSNGKPTVGLTMFGVTTPCVNAVKERLLKEGYETLVFHATGVGGKAMESLVKEGFIQGVLDITTTEVADYLIGGVMACDRAGAGTGISAKFEEDGGVDLIVVYNSGRFRMAGRGSLAGLLPFADANAIVLEMANEVLPVVKTVPVLAGVCASDPFRRMDYFLKQVESIGFSGVQNFPTVGLFDGNFRQNLEETGMGYGLEVKMIERAHKMGLLTTPYAFNEDEALDMANAGADIIVAHMGLTTSGSIGAKTALSMEESVVRVQAIADAAHRINPN